MANALLSQSQSQACDLAEQMGQRLKVTEAMLAEAVKARERLVENNKSTVEGLLSTISSNDQLLNVHTHTRSYPPICLRHIHLHPITCHFYRRCSFTIFHVCVVLPGVSGAL